MNSSQLLSIPTSAVLLCSLCACAGFSELHECGYQGCPDDARITGDVDALLNEHRNLQTADDQVYVQTLDHVVYLSGHVTTDMQRDRAELVAREAPGVTQVVDTLTVTADAGK